MTHDARHLLLDSPALGRRAHVWAFGHFGRPLVVFPSNAGVAHEWQKSGMIDALAPLLRAGRIKIYCTETNVSRSFSGQGGVHDRMAHHRAFESYVMDTLVPYIHQDCQSAQPITASGCSVGALYSSLFVLKYPEVFRRALCLSGRYRASTFFDGQNSEDLYFSDPMAFLPNLSGAALQRVRHQAHLTVVVGQGAHEHGCIPETRELGGLLQQKRIPNHIAFWGQDSAHTYPWWQKQARHYLGQMF